MVTLPLNADADLALDALFALTMVFFDTVHITSAVYCTKVVIFRNTPISFYDNPMSKNCGSSYESGEENHISGKIFCVMHGEKPAASGSSSAKNHFRSENLQGKI